MRWVSYRRAILRDDDKQPTEGVEDAYIADGGEVIAWRDGRALEDELFLSLSGPAVSELVEYAIELHGDELIDAHIRSASQNAINLAAVRLEILLDEFSEGTRTALGKAARSKASWFKTVGRMEEVARNIVGPDLPNAEAGFRELVERIFAWASGNDA